MQLSQTQPDSTDPLAAVESSHLPPGACHSGDVTCLKKALRATPFALNTKGYTLKNAIYILNVHAYL